MAIALPWVLLYVGCLAFYYKLDPGRWSRKDLPYISGLLGEGKDSSSEICIRIVAWSLAIATT